VAVNSLSASGKHKFKDEDIGRTWIPNEILLPEFYDATLGKPFRQYYRGLFLDAVNRHEPAVLKSLKVEVWEKYRQLRVEKQHQALLVLLRNWADTIAERFNLRDRWIVEFAEVTLNLWSGSPKWFDVVGWPSTSRGWGYSVSYSDDEIQAEMPAAKWEFLDERWDVFENRFSSEVRQFLWEYRKRITALALNKGYKKTPKKRSRDGRHPLVAFDWLALYHVQRKSAEQIAIKYDTQKTRIAGLRRNAVLEQVHWAASAIDLTLRKGKIRPPQSK